MTAITAFLLSVAMLPSWIGCGFGGNAAEKKSAQADTKESSPPSAGQVNDSRQNGFANKASAKNDRATGKLFIRFGKVEFQMIDASHTSDTNQYIPVGQSPDRWETMITVKKFNSVKSPQQAIDNVVQSLKIDHPGTPTEIKADVATSTYGIDFAIWNTDKTITEYNIHRYSPSPDGNGVIGKMFFMRAYGTAGHQRLIDVVVKGRASLTDQVYNYAFPEFVDP